MGLNIATYPVCCHDCCVLALSALSSTALVHPFAALRDLLHLQAAMALHVRVSVAGIVWHGAGAVHVALL